MRWQEESPLYLRQFDPGLSLEENVCEAFLRPESLLYDEPTNLIKQEVQKAAPFNAVIQAIAEGRSQNNEIAAAVGIQTSELTYYLKGLSSSGLVHADADSWLYAFSKSGFTRGAVEAAASRGLMRLVSRTQAARLARGHAPNGKSVATHLRSTRKHEVTANSNQEVRICVVVRT